MCWINIQIRTVPSQKNKNFKDIVTVNFFSTVNVNSHQYCQVSSFSRFLVLFSHCGNNIVGKELRKLKVNVIMVEMLDSGVMERNKDTTILKPEVVSLWPSILKLHEL